MGNKKKSQAPVVFGTTPFEFCADLLTIFQSLSNTAASDKRCCGSPAVIIKACGVVDEPSAGFLYKSSNQTEVG